MLVSGLAWLAAGIAWLRLGPATGFTSLFVGGVLIFPLSLLVSRAAGAPPAAKANPLNSLGFETTVPLFAGLLIAWLLLPLSPALAFAAFAMIVGARYFAFATLYRERVYWVLGGALFAIAFLYAGSDGALPANVAVATGITELFFAAVLYGRWRRAHG